MKTLFLFAFFLGIAQVASAAPPTFPAEGSTFEWGTYTPAAGGKPKPMTFYVGAQCSDIKTKNWCRLLDRLGGNDWYRGCYVGDCNGIEYLVGTVWAGEGNYKCDEAYKQCAAIVNAFKTAGKGVEAAWSGKDAKDFCKSNPPTKARRPASTFSFPHPNCPCPKNSDLPGNTGPVYIYVHDY